MNRISLIQKLRDDLKTAMKTDDAFSLGVLRMVIAALNNKSIEKRGKGLNAELTDEEARTLLAQEAKRRVEAAVVYETGGRKDMAEQEQKEASCIQKYLPAQLSREEIALVVEKIIHAARQGGADVSFATIIKEAMKELKGRADGARVGEIIKKKLE